MPSKYDAINKLKAENPELTWTQAANQAGFEGEWTSSKGKAKPRTGNVYGQTRRRASFDQPSTEVAGYEAKQLKKQRTRVSAQAEMFGLEPTQIEHLADQVDVKGLTAGAPGDPTNLLQVRQSEARYKDLVKLAVGKENAVTINPAEESLRVIPRKFFDPLADPSTLPGIDVAIGTKIEDVKNLVLQFNGGKAVLQVLPLVGLGAAVVTAGGQAMAGERTAAGATLAEAAVGEVPVVGDVLQSEPVAGGTFADVQRRTAEGVRAKQLQQRSAQARQRGGRLKVGFGGIKFALPELGLSELMGIN